MPREPHFAAPRAAAAPFAAAARRRRARSGLTLVELLVVVMIAVILLSLAVPLVRGVLADQDLREASRALNAHFAVAKARAAETRRPVGVWFERSAANPKLCIDVYLAEVPPPYVGDLQGATASLAYPGGVPTATFNPAQTQGLRFLVNVGDRITFGYQRPAYRITAIAAPDGDGDGLADSVQCTFAVVDAGDPLPPATPAGGFGSPFQIERQPQKLTLAAVELPAAVAIDLSVSGIGSGGSQFAGLPPGNPPVAVMFHPSGETQQVFYGRDNGAGAFVQVAEPPTSALYLLIGRPEKMGAANLEDAAAFWLRVSPRSGALTSAENGDNLGLPSGTPAELDLKLRTARKFALTGQSMGGL